MLFDLGVVLETNLFAGITDLCLFIQPIHVDASCISNQLLCRILILIYWACQKVPDLVRDCTAFTLTDCFPYFKTMYTPLKKNKDDKHTESPLATLTCTH